MLYPRSGNCYCYCAAALFREQPHNPTHTIYHINSINSVEFYHSEWRNFQNLHAIDKALVHFMQSLAVTFIGDLISWDKGPVPWSWNPSFRNLSFAVEFCNEGEVLKQTAVLEPRMDQNFDECPYRGLIRDQRSVSLMTSLSRLQLLLLLSWIFEEHILTKNQSVLTFEFGLMSCSCQRKIPKKWKSLWRGFLTLNNNSNSETR